MATTQCKARLVPMLEEVFFVLYCLLYDRLVFYFGSAAVFLGLAHRNVDLVERPLFLRKHVFRGNIELPM